MSNDDKKTPEMILLMGLDADAPVEWRNPQNGALYVLASAAESRLQRAVDVESTISTHQQLDENGRTWKERAETAEAQLEKSQRIAMSLAESVGIAEARIAKDRATFELDCRKLRGRFVEETAKVERALAAAEVRIAGLEETIRNALVGPVETVRETLEEALNPPRGPRST